MNFRSNLEIVFCCVALLWIVYFVGLFLPFDLQAYGIRPRSIEGLSGLIFAHFLHSGPGHLLSNTPALAALLFFSLTYSRRLTLNAVIFIALAGGAGTWALATPNTVHVGASGIIFGLIGFLVSIGLFRREWTALLVSMVVAVYYGWAMFSLLVVAPGVSWSGHFFGFAAGVAAAWLTKRDGS